MEIKKVGFDMAANCPVKTGGGGGSREGKGVGKPF